MICFMYCTHSKMGKADTFQFKPTLSHFNILELHPSMDKQIMPVLQSTHTLFSPPC